MSETGRSSLGAMMMAALLAALTAGSAPWWWPKSTANQTPAPEPHGENSLEAGARHAPDPKLAVADPSVEPPLYRAVLGCADHRNSGGVALKDAAMIVRQDRANYHELNKRDTEDTPDGAFTRNLGRDALQKGLQLAPGQATTIVTKTPTVSVFKVGSGYRLDILQEGSPLDQCPDAPPK